jgi:hypothetical protein
MVNPLIYTALAKLAVDKLSHLDSRDVTQALNAIGKATRRMPWLPGLGGLGIGLVAGTAIGFMLAPRPGKETRAAVRDMLRNRWKSMRASAQQAVSGQASDVAPAPTEPPNTGNGARASTSN